MSRINSKDSEWVAGRQSGMNQILLGKDDLVALLQDQEVAIQSSPISLKCPSPTLARARLQEVFFSHLVAPDEPAPKPTTARYQVNVIDGAGTVVDNPMFDDVDEATKWAASRATRYICARTGPSATIEIVQLEAALGKIEIHPAEGR